MLTANPPPCGGGEPRTIHALRAGAAGGAIRALQYAGVVAGPDGSVAATAPTCELVPGQSAGDGDVVRCDQVVPLTILSRPLTIGERHIFGEHGAWHGAGNGTAHVVCARVVAGERGRQ